MSKAQEIMKQLMENKDQEAFSSEENLRKTLGERGCSPEEIDEVLAGFDGFPLDDDDLEAASGGANFQRIQRTEDPYERKYPTARHITTTDKGTTARG